jgi:hypothetical protein
MYFITTVQQTPSSLTVKNNIMKQIIKKNMPRIGDYISYNGSMDIGMETFFDSFYGKVTKIVGSSVEVDILHIDQKDKRKKERIPLSYFVPGGYEEIVKEGFSSLSRKTNKYRAEILSPLKMKQIIERNIDYSGKRRKDIKNEKNNVNRLKEILVKIVLPICTKHSYQLIKEDVDKWWVNYHFRCIECGAEKIQKGCT